MSTTKTTTRLANNCVVTTTTTTTTESEDCPDLTFQAQMQDANRRFKGRCQQVFVRTGRMACVIAVEQRKARKRVSLPLRNRILWRQHFVCFICKQLPAKPTWEIDHWIPRSDSGADHEHNYVLLCACCHKAKTAYEQCHRYDGAGWYDVRNNAPSPPIPPCKLAALRYTAQQVADNITSYGVCKVCNVVYSTYFTHTCAV
jgi:hypothetical protein